MILSTTKKQNLIELNQKYTYVINNKGQALFTKQRFQTLYLACNVGSTFALTLTFKIPILTILNIKNGNKI